jgi:hypothetical protein
MNENFIEQQIITAVRGLLSRRVNEVLGDWQCLIPIIEFSNYQGMASVVPVITLSSCERTEKERIARLDTYSLTITFNVPETADSELFCYAYGAAVSKALGENPTLGGVADRAVVTGKKYNPPKKPNCGDGWGVVISLRVTVEEISNAC